MDLLGVRLDLFDGMVAYFSQALVDIAPNIEECTMPRFSVDGSLKQNSKNIIVRVNFTFRRMTKDCHLSQKTEKNVDGYG